MKHIFMGQINTIGYYCLYSYNPMPEDLFMAYMEDRIYNFKNYLAIKEHIADVVGIPNSYIKEKRFEKILETNLIQERCLENSYIKLNDEEYYINKVVQCTNGDVICYTNNIIKEIKDEESLSTCNKIIKDFEKYRIQRMKQKQEEKKIHKKKKWYKFWKKEGN